MSYTIDDCLLALIVIGGFFVLATAAAFLCALFDGWRDDWAQGSIFNYLPY